MGLMQRTFPDEACRALAGFPPEHRASAVLRLLYLAQAAYGYVGREAVAEVAGLVGIDETRVRGLVGFYTLFYDRPVGKFVIHYCNDLPCALRGADEFLPKLCARLGLQPGETSADGLFTLEAVKCLAACDRAPVMQVNLEYFHELTEDSLDEVIADLRTMAASEPPRRPPFGVGPPSDVVRVGASASDEGAEMARARGADRVTDRGADGGADRGADRGANRGADRGTDRGADRG